MPPPKAPRPNTLALDPATIVSRRAVETLERELIFGAVRSYRFYQAIKDTVAPWDPEKLMHRLDFSVARYNSLWSFVAAFYRRFANTTLVDDIRIPNHVLAAYVVDSHNRHGTPRDLAEELVNEITGETELTAGLDYQSSMALFQSEAFNDWLQSRILEQTTGNIAVSRSLGMLTMASLVELVEKGKQAAGGQHGLAKRINDRMHTPGVEIPQPATCFSVSDIPVCTPGNLTTISGQSKAGKTAVIGAMMASTFALPTADCLGFKSSNPSQFGVIHVDTEQSTFDHQELLKLTARRAGQPLPPCVKSSSLTGFSPTEIRQAVPLLLEQCKKEFGGVHSLILDGVADTANDVNDPGEANAIVAELHALAIKFDCAIIICIHLNPGSESKMRGHLGSQCERKAESNIRIEKDKDEISVLYADKNRRSPIFKKNGPRFTWSHEEKMHLSIESLAQSKQESAKSNLQLIFQTILTGNQSLSFSKLSNALQNSRTMSKTTSERRITDAFNAGIIEKNTLHHYVLKT